MAVDFFKEPGFSFGFSQGFSAVSAVSAPCLHVLVSGAVSAFRFGMIFS